MFRNGDRVWDIRKGWGTVVAEYPSDPLYPIRVRLDRGDTDGYTSDGRFNSHDLYPSLFDTEVKIVKLPRRVKRSLPLSVFRNFETGEYAVWNNVGNIDFGNWRFITTGAFNFEVEE